MTSKIQASHRFRKLQWRLFPPMETVRLGGGVRSRGGLAQIGRRAVQPVFHVGHQAQRRVRHYAVPFRFLIAVLGIIRFLLMFILRLFVFPENRVSRVT